MSSAVSYEFHEASTIFPMMDRDDFEALKSDIAEHGLREPIVLHEGKIVDGRNRYKACDQLGIEPEIVEWDGDDPIAFVVSLNLHRRHLTESQRAMIAARIKPKFEAEAHTRQVAAQNNRVARAVRANLPEQVDIGRPRERAASVTNVSPRSVEAGSKVLKKGSRELINAVDRGEVKVSTAAVVSSLPKEEQNEILAAGPRAVKQKAKEVREARSKPEPPQAPERESVDWWPKIERYLRREFDSLNPVDRGILAGKLRLLVSRLESECPNLVIRENVPLI